MPALRAHRQHGISVLGILVAIMILAAMGAAMSVLVSTNQDMRINQYYADQSFASAQGGVEMALGLIHQGVSPCSSFNRNLLGDAITVSRTGGRIYVTGSKSSGTSSFSLTDPVPPTGSQILTVDTTHAKDASNGAPPKKLIDIRLQLNAACGSTVTITTMVVTWSPDHDERVDQIKFDGNNIYNSGGGTESGDLINVTDTTISDASVHTIDFIRWGDTIQNRLYTIKLNYSDGSNKTVTVDTR